MTAPAQKWPGGEWLVPWMPLAFAVIAFLCWGCRDLWDPTEARYGQAAFEMLHSHNWLTPTLAGAPHLTKPPLSYWLIALGMKIFGVNPWGARFFLSCSFLATLFAVQSLGKTMGFASREAKVAALIYATSAIPFAGGHTLSTDGFLVFWETLGVLAAWRVWRGQGHGVSFWRLIFWVSFGLAFLTKGPPGLLPFVAIAVFHFLRRLPERHEGDFPDKKNGLFSVGGFLLFVVISFSWYGLLVWQQHDLIGYFLGDEVYNRIFTANHHRDAPFWIYFPILVAGVGPWLIVWPRAVRQWWQFRPGTGKKMEDWQLFCLLWIVLSLLIFMISKSRLVFYVLPLFVPISLILGHECLETLNSFPFTRARWRQGGMVVAGLWMLAMVAYTTGMGWFFPQAHLRPAAHIFKEALALENQGNYQVYWLWTGRQRYSLSFSMGQIIRVAETILPQYAGISSTPYYITEEKILAIVDQNGWHAFGGPPRVLARAQGMVLFTMKPMKSLLPFMRWPTQSPITPEEKMREP